MPSGLPVRAGEPARAYSRPCRPVRACAPPICVVSAPPCGGNGNNDTFRADRVLVHPVGMGEVYPMPSLGDVFDDVRDNGRSMRISCHADRDAVVVSLWHETLCRGSFRLSADDLGRLVSTLAEMSTSLRPPPPAEGAASEGSDPEQGAAPPVPRVA